MVYEFLLIFPFVYLRNVFIQKMIFLFINDFLLFNIFIILYRYPP